MLLFHASVSTRTRKAGLRKAPGGAADLATGAPMELPDGAGWTSAEPLRDLPDRLPSRLDGAGHETGLDGTGLAPGQR